MLFKGKKRNITEKKGHFENNHVTTFARQPGAEPV